MTEPSPERLHIARELHDGIAQDLVGIGYSLDLLLAEPSLSNLLRSQIRETRLEVDRLISKVRGEILNLRNPVEKPFRAQLEELTARYIPNLSLNATYVDSHIPSDIQRELESISAEILRNIAAHSRASQVVIKLYPVNNRTCLEISDNGKGGTQMKDNHFGLQTITERVHSIHGSISIKNIEGTHIAILI